jgi:hypothetical protein
VVSERLPLARRPLAVLACFLFAHAALQCGVLGLSSLSVSIAGFVPVVLLALSLACGLWAARHVLQSVPSSAPPNPIRRAYDFGRLTALVLLAYAALVFVQLLVIAWLRPVYDWDGLYYHVPSIHGWARAGRVAWLGDHPDVPFVNGYPMAAEVVAFFLNQLGAERLVDAANLCFWPLASCGLIVLASALGAPRYWAMGCGGAIALVPLWVAQSATAYVDPAFAACCIAVLALAVPLVSASGSEARLLGLLLGPALGLCAATKGLGIPFALWVFLALAVARLLRQQLSLTLAWRPILLTPLLAVAVAGFWPLRNGLHTGNPLYPVGLQIAGWTVFDGVDARAHTLLNLPHWLIDVPAALRPLVAWTQPDAPVVHYGAISGLGYIWLLAGMPCTVVLALLLLRAQSAARRWRSGFLLFVAASTFLFQPAPWWGRFTLWLHGVGLPASAVVLHLAGGHPGAARRTLRLGLVALLLGTGVSESLLALRAQWRDGLGVWPSQVYVDSAGYVFPRAQDRSALERLLRAQRIARSSHSRWGTLLGGALAQPIGARELVHVDPDLRVEELLALDVEWLVWDVIAAGPCPRALADQTELEHVLRDRPGVQIELRRVLRRPFRIAQPLSCTSNLLF